MPKENKLLKTLSKDELEKILPSLKKVNLSRGQVLCEPGDPLRYLYFIRYGIISLTSISEDGSTVEISAIGNEGVAGVLVCLGESTLPFKLTVQLAGSAMRIRADKIREMFNKCGPLHNLLLRYTRTLFVQIAQGVVCNRFHTTEARLSRWLLVAHDRVQSATLPVTQDFLAEMLGSLRPTISLAANLLQQAGLIRYARGQITILNRPGLESTTCECYRVVKSEFDKLLTT